MGDDRELDAALDGWRIANMRALVFSAGAVVFGSFQLATAQTSTDECIQVPAELVAVIEDGFEEAARGQWRLRNAAAVKSQHFKRLFFISAQIVGPTLGNPPPVGTWASNSLVVGQGMLFSVGPWSTEFSVYPDGSKTKAGISWMDHGYAESKDCVRRNARQ